MPNIKDSRSQIVFLILGLTITILASSIKSVYQIYFIDLPEIYSLGRSEVSLLGALFGLFVGVFSPITGWLCDKYGASQTILSGIIIAVLGFAGIYSFDSIFLLIICFSVLLSYSFTAITFIPFGILIDKVFREESKGLSYTILINGTAIGFIFLSPLWVYLNNILTWKEVNGFLSIAYFVLLIPIGIYLYKKYPEISDSCSLDKKNSSIYKFILDSKFIFLALSFGGCGMAMAFIDVHLVALLKNIDNFYFFSSSDSFIASSLSILGITELIGSFLVAFAIRYFNLYLVLGFLYLIRCLIFISMNLASSDVVYLGLLSAFGLTYMGTVIISSLLCLRWYGIEIKGRMFGLLFLFHQVFVFISIWMGGLIYDNDGNYIKYIFILFLISLLAALAAFKLYKISLNPHLLKRSK